MYRYAPHNDLSVNDGPRIERQSHNIITQGDQKVSVHVMITIQKVTSNVQRVSADRQGQEDTRLTLTGGH
jgi:hypothetical protein